MTMEHTPAHVHPAEMPASAPPAETPDAPKPRRRPGRPQRWIVPTDGSLMSPELLAAIKKRDDSRRKYNENTEAELARIRRNYHVRVERQKEVARQLAELKKAYVGVMLPGLPAAQASLARVPA